MVVLTGMTPRLGGSSSQSSDIMKETGIYHLEEPTGEEKRTGEGKKETERERGARLTSQDRCTWY